MKVKGKYKYDYSAINLKRPVVKRFGSLSRKYSKTQSETLNAMIDFFEWHGFSPFDKMEKSLLAELLKNRKRTEAVIAIMKDIEKNQTKPTVAMIQSLFTEVEPANEPRMIAKSPEEFRAEFENKNKH